jgi:putative tricarboxylic transport membrane protein
MDVWAQLMQGFAVALTAQNLMWCLVGCALGTASACCPAWVPR